MSKYQKQKSDILCKELWIWFYHGEERLGGMTLRGAFTGEIEIERAQLADTHSISEAEVTVKIERESTDFKEKDDSKHCDNVAAEEVAARLRDWDSWNRWNYEDCEELCMLADMEKEWKLATVCDFESVLNEAARRTGVKIYSNILDTKEFKDRFDWKLEKKALEFIRKPELEGYYEWKSSNDIISHPRECEVTNEELGLFLRNAGLFYDDLCRELVHRAGMAEEYYGATGKVSEIMRKREDILNKAAEALGLDIWKEPEIKPFTKEALSNEIHLDFVGLDDYDRPLYVITNHDACLIDTAGKNAEYPDLNWGSRKYSADENSAGEPEDLFRIPEEAELFVTSSFGYEIPDNIKSIAKSDVHKLELLDMKVKIAEARKNKDHTFTKQKRGNIR